MYPYSDSEIPAAVSDGRKKKSNSFAVNVLKLVTNAPISQFVFRKVFARCKTRPLGF